MSPALLLASFAILSVLLAIAAAAAGALWWRARSQPLLGVARLARDLAERQRVLEELIRQLDVREAARPVPAGPRSATPRPARVDPPATSAYAGPTLIAVPDLSHSTHPPDHASAPAAAELGLRFGAIWDLADQGLAVDAIARRAGYPIGQVELILGLRRGLANAESRP